MSKMLLSDLRPSLLPSSLKVLSTTKVRHSPRQGNWPGSTMKGQPQISKQNLARTVQNW
jgi:hypothetical protein